MAGGVSFTRADDSPVGEGAGSGGNLRTAADFEAVLSGLTMYPQVTAPGQGAASAKIHRLWRQRHPVRRSNCAKCVSVSVRFMGECQRGGTSKSS